MKLDVFAVGLLEEVVVDVWILLKAYISVAALNVSNIGNNRFLVQF